MKDGFRNEAGAYFEKDPKSAEGYYHICDDIRRDAMPEIWRHDCHTWIYLGDHKQYIRYCPLCGKSME